MILDIMRKEIGSEFWLDSELIKSTKGNIDNMFPGYDKKFLFSGRSAIDYVLEDMYIEEGNVYMPSYCCNSMLIPFLNRGLGIIFYDVYIGNNGLEYNINEEIDVDIFFANNYFGFNSSNMDCIIKKFRKRDIPVIEDITHRLLSSPSFSKEANYLIGSVRKWVSIISGGIAVKIAGDFSKHNFKEAPIELIDIKKNAMELKNEYLKLEEVNLDLKKNFLSLFSKFNNGLAFSYKNKSIDKLSLEMLNNLDFNDVKNKRIENTKALYSYIKSIDGIKVLYNKIHDNKDCPLFMPILLKNRQIRDDLATFLRTKEIYCPIHWPISDNHILTKETKEIYERGLSLICDQRYSSQDMSRISSTIEEFFEYYA